MGMGAGMGGGMGVWMGTTIGGEIGLGIEDGSTSCDILGSLLGCTRVFIIAGLGAWISSDADFWGTLSVNQMLSFTIYLPWWPLEKLSGRKCPKTRFPDLVGEQQNNKF